MVGTSTSIARTSVRPEIQALRALAVLAVVFHHGWPAVSPAGYMGVDVFFVVSGFLITGLLLREVERTGRLSLGGFYLRRARRILPAAVAVLLAVSIATIAVVPQQEWNSWFREIVASALYYENWRLLADSQTPGLTDLASTPVQHYWSLSVEEQFYLVWPLLLIGAIALARRRGIPVAKVAFVVLGVVTAVSFSHSVALTVQDHNLAYFSTIARTWEFGVGGMLAIAAASPVPGRDRLRAAVSWTGLVLIVVPIVLFRDPEAFPGLWVIIPVAGTMGVIWAGMPQTAWSPARIIAWRPVQWTGDISYSLYLWHWPIILLMPYFTGVPSPPWLMVILVVAAFVAADLSKRMIEDPFRSGRPARRIQPAVLLGGIAVAVGVVVGTGLVAPGVAADQTVACENSRRD